MNVALIEVPSINNLSCFHNISVIPTTMEISGSNWDFPFGSPSLNAFVIEGLKKSNDKECMEVAVELAKVLVKTCYEGFNTQGSLFKEVRLLPKWVMEVQNLSISTTSFSSHSKARGCTMGTVGIVL